MPFVTTKFSIGDHLFFARSRDSHVEVKRDIDGETWIKRVVDYVPYVREKMIVGIRITLRDGVQEIDYELLNVDEMMAAKVGLRLPWVVSEEKLVEKAFENSTDAMDAAMKAASEGRTLYD